MQNKDEILKEALLIKYKSLTSSLRKIEEDTKLYFGVLLTPLISLISVILSSQSEIINKLIMQIWYYFTINLRTNPKDIFDFERFKILSFSAIAILIIFFVFNFFKMYLINRGYIYIKLKYSLISLENYIGMDSDIILDYDISKKIEIEKRETCLFGKIDQIIGNIFKILKFEIFKDFAEFIRIFLFFLIIIELVFYFFVTLLNLFVLQGNWQMNANSVAIIFCIIFFITGHYLTTKRYNSLKQEVIKIDDYYENKKSMAENKTE